MNIKNKIVVVIMLMFSVSMYGIDYLFAKLSLEDPSLNQIEAYNPRYVDKSLIIVDDLADDFSDSSWYMKLPAQGFIYGVNLPILRCAELYEYPGYSTFSRFITNPSVFGVSVLTAAYWYKTSSYQEKCEVFNDEDEVINYSDKAKFKVAQN